MLVSLLTGVATVVAGEKPRHFGDDVIMVVMHVEVNLFVFFWTGVDDFIAIFFRHDTDLVFAQQFRTDQKARRHFDEVPLPGVFA